MENPLTHKTIVGYKVREFFAFLLLIVLIILSVILLYFKIQEGAIINGQNQGYIRYVACTIDICVEQGVNTVSEKISEACWEQAEREVGQTLNRYTEKILLENKEK